MRVFYTLVAVLTSTAFLAAQTQTTTTSQTSSTTKIRRHHASAPAVTQADLQALKDQMTAQQQQIQQLQQQLQERDQAVQQMQQQLSQTQSTASDAQSKASEAQSTASQTTATVTKLQSDVTDVKNNATNAAVSTQDEQKKLTEVSKTLDRFHVSGDVRVRGESFFQNPVPDRNRARIRLRLGIEGDPNQDFTGGLYVASGFVAGSGGPAGAVGSVANPVSANDTLTNFFERKAISFDRGYIIYHPQGLKWLRLTGGKFAYDFPRTDITFDPDLNPEGFTEKFSFDVHNSVFKNFTVEGMELLFNEVAGGISGSGASLKINPGVDSNAVGGYGGLTLQFGPWKTTPSYMLLNWNGADPIAQAVSPVPLCASTGPLQTTCILQPKTPPAGSILPNPVATPSAFLQTNAMTNATRIVGKGTGLTRAFVSGFEYSDFIWDNTITTPWKRFPFNFKAEFEKNLRAKLNVGFAPSVQDNAYWFDANLGQQKNKHDLQLGYSWWRVEQDAVISSFAQDDQRAPTNNLQNRIYANYLLAANTTAGFTWWVGRTLNRNLQNAVVAPLTPKGAQEPYLNRLQFDLIYKF
jgi:Putative porin